MPEQKGREVPVEHSEDLVSSHVGPDGPKAPPRDKRPERQYPKVERKTGVNRTDPDAPGGPVNIPVKR